MKRLQVFGMKLTKYHKDGVFYISDNWKSLSLMISKQFGAPLDADR